MFFYFKVSSKDSKVLEKFFQFLLKLETFPTVLKYIPKQKRKKFITILKSPHVNKTAQEQFEFRFYTKQFVIDSLKPLKFFLILKKIKNLSFPGIKLEVKGLFNIKKKNQSFLRAIDPDNIILLGREHFKSTDQQSNRFFQKKYIQLFDCYGEVYLKDALCFKNKIS